MIGTAPTNAITFMSFEIIVMWCNIKKMQVIIYKIGR